VLSFKTSSSGGDSWFARLRGGLARTREQFGGRLAGLFGSARALDEAFYRDLETALITADVGVAASAHLLAALRSRARREALPTPPASRKRCRRCWRSCLRRSPCR